MFIIIDHAKPKLSLLLTHRLSTLISKIDDFLKSINQFTNDLPSKICKS